MARFITENWIQDPTATFISILIILTWRIAVLTQNDVQKAFQYNEITGEFKNKITRSNNSLVGKIITCKDTAGYLRVNFKGKVHTVHRLIWLYIYGYLPKEVDHINHDRADNSLINLRENTTNLNNKNKTKYKCNKSGHNGVIWHKVAKKWQAIIRVNKRSIYLGLFENIQDAVIAREEATIKHEFHINHGK